MWSRQQWPAGGTGAKLGARERGFVSKLHPSGAPREGGAGKMGVGAGKLLWRSSHPWAKAGGRPGRGRAAPGPAEFAGCPRGRGGRRSAARAPLPGARRRRLAPGSTPLKGLARDGRRGIAGSAAGEPRGWAGARSPLPRRPAPRSAPQARTRRTPPLGGAGRAPGRKLAAGKEVGPPARAEAGAGAAAEPGSGGAAGGAGAAGGSAPLGPRARG